MFKSVDDNICTLFFDNCLVLLFIFIIFAKF